ncbi:MAG: FAD:protein FMN transferase [Bacteroidales bacterium]|nr:FAD:protein FMN transferase [Bacteroidales bacterium]
MRIASHHRTPYILLTLTLTGTLLCGCHRQEQPRHIAGEAQGSFYSIIYYDSAGRDLKPMVDSLLRDFDLTASLWNKGSLIRRLNDNTTDTVTPLMASMLTHSLEIWRYTGGAFDCTVGGLVNAWGFGFKNRDDITDTAIDRLLSYTGSAQLNIDTVTLPDGKRLMRLRKPHPATELDLNAIAQGETVDLIDGLFASLGLRNYLIYMGGEIIARGAKADGRPWSVGIERPANDSLDAPQVEEAIGLSNLSVVTSGNYRKYYEKDGTKYSHTIDPATGRPVTHTLLSVSVVDSCAWRADAMATAFMVMGLDKARAFIDDHRGDSHVQAVYFIYNDGGEYKTYATPEFEKLILK